MIINFGFPVESKSLSPRPSPMSNQKVSKFQKHSKFENIIAILAFSKFQIGLKLSKWNDVKNGNIFVF